MKLVGSFLHVDKLQRICLPVAINDFSMLDWSIWKIAQVINNFEQMFKFCIRSHCSDLIKEICFVSLN